MSFPAYPDYRDSGIAWLGKVPSHWLVMPLKRRFSVALGKMLQPDAKTDDDIERPYLRAANIKWGHVDIDDVKTMWFSPHEVNNLELRAGDLLVSEGGDVGRSAIWRNEVADCHFQNSVNRVRSITDSRTDFLFYWMSTIKAKGYVDVLCNKSTIAHFTAEKVAAVPLPVPTPDEQAAIAAFLDRETAKIDALVTEKERLIALLKEKRQAVISHAVTRGLNSSVTMKDSGSEWLGEIPAHWTVSPLKHLTPTDRAIMYGIVLPGPDVGEGVPIVKGGDVKGHRLRLDLLCYTTPEIEAPFARARLRPNDIVYSIRGSIGDAELVPGALEDANITQDVARISPIPEVNHAWLLHVMRSKPIFVQLEQRSLGAAVRGINIFDLKRAAIPLPPRMEQDAIAEFLEEQTKTLSDLEHQMLAGIELLKERRAALISAAVTGKIDVRGALSPDNVVSIDTARTSGVQPSIRASVGALSIRTLGSMGRMAVMKGGYLAEGYAGISELDGTYHRDAAGPFCRAVIDGMERDAAQAFGIQVIQPIKEGERVTYRLPSNFALPANDLPALFGEDRAKRLAALFDLLKGLNRDGVEAIATLFAVWNDLLACGKSADDDAVIRGVLEDWHPEKAVKFNGETLAHWLAWMRRNHIVPDGTAPRTDHQGSLFQ
ncbi:MAG: restriction endonuclease subunit S [Altererythrobacter sp.]|nr:restriction endonuclease subunit S [Altererythrobacter sp.]